MKESVVSPRIMPGIDSVSEAIRWLVKEGTMWRKMMRSSLAPASLAAMTKVLLAQRHELAAHHARQARPADEREDDHDAKVDLGDRPARRQRGAERHPQRQRRHGAQELDDTLHDHVERAAIVAGEAAESTPRKKDMAMPTRPMESEMRPP